MPSKTVLTLFSSDDSSKSLGEVHDNIHSDPELAHVHKGVNTTGCEIGPMLTGIFLSLTKLFSHLKPEPAPLGVQSFHSY